VWPFWLANRSSREHSNRGVRRRCPLSVALEAPAPPWSVIEQGEPTEVSFRTTNGRPMEMEADQRLNGSVDLAWCGGIQVVISRTREDTAVLELILIDSESGQWETLGASESDRNALDFPIPTSGSLDKFNEIKVVYHRPASFSKKSARIAIERFVIVPR
jgi:hypothetical protein